MDSKFITIAAALMLQAGGVIWWASTLQGQVRHNGYQIQILQRSVEKNSDFVEKWPAGKWGSGELPSDTRQDLKIAALEKMVEKMMARIYEMNGGY